MYCPNCKKENAENFRYCQFCGTALSHSAIMNCVDASDVGDSVPPASTLSVPDSIEDWMSSADSLNASSSSLALSDFPELNDPSSDGISVDISLAEFDSSSKAKSPGRTDISPKRAFEDNMPSGLSEFMKAGGASLSGSQPVARICSECGAIVSEGHRFCGNCGKRYELDDDSPAPQRDPSSSSGAFRFVERANFVPEYGKNDENSFDVAFTLCHIRDDGSVGESIPLIPGENIIGRNSSDPLGNDKYINPKHIRLTCEDDCVVVEDYNSLNGVFLRISDDSVVLRNGDVFRIGEELLCYFHGDSVHPLLTSQISESTELLGGAESDGWGYIRVVMGAFSEGNVFRLSQETVTLGRTVGDILFPKDGFVSGKHASIKAAKDYAVLTDLDSSNGTFIRLKAPYKVTKETFILIGNQLLRIQPKV